MKPNINDTVLCDRGIGKITRISGRSVTVAKSAEKENPMAWAEFHLYDNFDSRWDRVNNLFDMRGVI